MRCRFYLQGCMRSFAICETLTNMTQHGRAHHHKIVMTYILRIYQTLIIL